MFFFGLKRFLVVSVTYKHKNKAIFDEKLAELFLLTRRIFSTKYN